MESAVTYDRDVDLTDASHIARRAVVIGLITAVAVLLFSLVSRFTGGIIEAVLAAVIVIAGIYAVTFLPGQWTRARTIEGIAGAAGIGLAGAVVFLFIDVILLQNIGTYSNRWRAIGGGSNWWYHPVWWMVGAYLPWLGAFILANQAERGGINVAKAVGLVAVFAAVFGVLAVVLHVPHAGWNLGTFAVAVLPALAAATWVSGLGAPQRG
jgi:hypothetical protein